MSAVPYTRSQLLACLGSHTMNKAAGYVRAVSRLRATRNAVTARVQGTQPQPYDVAAHVEVEDGELRVEGSCTCPVGFNCKHVAATLLAALDDPIDRFAPLSTRVEVAAGEQDYPDRPDRPAPPRIGAERGHRLGGDDDGDDENDDEDGDDEDDASVHGHPSSAVVLPWPLALPWPVKDKAATTIRAIDVEPVPVLRLDTLPVFQADFGRYRYGSRVLDFATVAFEYGDVSMQADNPATLLTLPGGRMIQVARRYEVEQARLAVLSGAGFESIAPGWVDGRDVFPAGMIGMPDPAAWPDFVREGLPMLRAEGWRVEMTTDFRFNVIDIDTIEGLVRRVDEDDDEQAHAQEAAEGTGSASGDATSGGRYSAGRKIAGGETASGRVIRGVVSGAIRAARRGPAAGALAGSAAGATVGRTLSARPGAAPAGAAGSGASLPARLTNTPNLAPKRRGGWFDLEMGISVGERQVRLEPLLALLFKRDRRWLSGALDAIPDDEPIELMTELHERLRIRADRLKPVVRVLIDLFGDLSKERLRISTMDLGRLAALTDTGRWQFSGDASIEQLVTRLRDTAGMVHVAPPAGLTAVLRTYQQHGVDWMQFLRANNLSGVLADDMGLGKTVQTLAHVLIEKEAGRLDRPVLIVVPTTLVHNWSEEARRFAPGLTVLDLHGPQRGKRFGEISSHDLVLTTYALLWRDHEALAEHAYHLLILDEAQYVKNVTSKAAGVIRALQARHRLCLSGTPLENHLGELWAQFDFLMPGFLGSQQAFTRDWRKPIERHGDGVRLKLLSSRIRPFMLRRRKSDVATELPPKTTIVRTVELEGAQRDLYEAVRVAMQQKVRMVMAAQGSARSHIIVLDAMLKLRQACCDPRLVKLENSPRVAGSAKLDVLISMLQEMIDGGRRILVFSQFTGMLALIAAALDDLAIDYLTLTGDTADRVTPVERFQRGEVPLFLISLKAGGVGLNLTAADTVIHYDPWWNPAAENQATDRAHRIGQDKPVFVYKLIAAGTIEERIVALQERKSALADDVLSKDGALASKFSEAELDALFSPLPDAS